MSIVAVHSGEIAKPRKNTVTMKPDTPITMSWKRITGTSPATAKTQLLAIISERAICRLPVRRSKCVGGHPAEQLGEKPGEQQCHVKECRFLDLDTIVFLQQGRHPGHKQPAGPALAEIDDHQRRHAGNQASPRHRAGTGQGCVISSWQCSELGAGDARVLARILVEIPPPHDRPEGRYECRPRQMKNARRTR